VPLDATGHATFTTAALAAGGHTIWADYSGDADFAASTQTTEQTVEAASQVTTTTTVVTASPDPSNVGQTVALTATVTAPQGDGVATGTVTFLDGMTVLGTGTLDEDGLASFSTSGLAAGDHAITAAYGGDPTFSASSSIPVDVTIAGPAVTPTPTATTITASTNRADLGQPVTFTAIVGPQDPGADPSGLAGESAQFTIDEGSTTVVPLQDVDGQEVATLTTSTLAAGTHTVTAAFAGDPAFAPSASNGVTVDVAAPSPTPTPTPTATTSSPIPVAPADGPRVMDLQRFGYHAQPTVLVLTFDETLDPSTATDPANYTIVPLGPHGKNGHAIAIARVSYNAAARTVTLRPSRRLNVHDRFELLVDGTSTHAVVDMALRALDGGRSGQAGSDYVGPIDWSAIAGPSLPGQRYARAWRKLVASGVVGR
jgi:hypothetical protein